MYGGSAPLLITPRTTRKTPVRPPLDFSKGNHTPRLNSIRFSQKLPFLNPSKFQSVDDFNANVNSIRKNSQKLQERQFDYWVENSEPSPLEIIQKISEVSEIHESILQLWVKEFSKLPEDSEINPFFNIEDDNYDLLSKLHIELLKLNDEIEESRAEELMIIDELEYERAKHDNALCNFNAYKKIFDNGNFDESETVEDAASSREDQEEEMSPEMQMEYNNLWGKNRYLKDETQALKYKIDEHHEEQLRIALASARQTVAEKESKDPKSKYQK